MQVIDKFEERLWTACVSQRAVQNSEEADLWQTDHLAQLQQRFMVSPLPEDLRPMMQESVEAWDRIEREIYSRTKSDRSGLLVTFSLIRELQPGQRLPLQILPFVTNVRGAVRNLDWVNLFAFVLPLADAANRSSHLARGQTAVATFYIEKIGGAILSGGGEVDETRRKLDALAQLVGLGSAANSAIHS